MIDDGERSTPTVIQSHYIMFHTGGEISNMCPYFFTLKIFLMTDKIVCLNAVYFLRKEHG